MIKRTEARSLINCQLSTVNCQLSTVNCQHPPANSNQKNQPSARSHSKKPR
ncbi:MULTISPECIES: hypothetical protein [unclassified Microcoleus]|uniref:hypothetical protein n=1 Tax=unclassified Microcoleus TaxID=2642155 RepID=UPI0025DF6BF2|nr:MULTISPECIES: hypothetical protein [unclassified Microcoleus]